MGTIQKSNSRLGMNYKRVRIRKIVNGYSEILLKQISLKSAGIYGIIW